MNPVCRIQIRHLLPRGSDDLTAIAIAVREQFAASGSAADNVWLIEGTDPETQKFENFNLSDSGVLFTFDEYEVGPYSAGRQQVVVPYARLNGNLTAELS
ncbi:MAG: DUF3298 domain-containing protein [bacterium]|nr:DUF3298 domain-containing protein [bacterium]